MPDDSRHGCTTFKTGRHSSWVSPITGLLALRDGFTPVSSRAEPAGVARALGQFRTHALPAKLRARPHRTATHPSIGVICVQAIAFASGTTESMRPRISDAGRG